MILVEILFARLLTEETTVPHPSSRKQAPFVMQGTRHRWLDNVVPFGGGGGGGVGEEEEEEEREGETRNHKEPQRRKHDYRLHDLLQLQVQYASLKSLQIFSYLNFLLSKNNVHTYTETSKFVTVCFVVCRHCCAAVT